MTKSPRKASTNHTAAISDTELISLASAFEVRPFDPEAWGVRRVVVERRCNDPEAWAITQGGGGSSVLSRRGDWIYEPLPSNRSDSFLKETRWPTAIAAIKFVRAHLARHPSGYRDLPMPTDLKHPVPAEG